MKLYIQVQDGNPINHPAFEDNLIEAFGAVPDDWEPFTRIPISVPEYHVLLDPEPKYKKVDGVWADVWQFREMTPEEKAQVDADKKELQERKIQLIKDEWASRPYASNFAAWTFDESQMRFVAPIPRPADKPPVGMVYRWYGPGNNWRLAEHAPDDGKQYYFDFDNWVHVEITQ